MKIKKAIVDTTLRDGEQSPYIALRPEDKLKIASLLDRLKVYEIEAGTPCIGRLERDSIAKIIENRKHSLISVWSRMRKEDVRESIACSPDIIHIGAPVSYVQIYHKLKKNKSWVQKSILECVEVAKKGGVKVTVGFEDASRADIGFMINMAMMLEKAGVTTIRLADTVGVLTPNRTHEIVKELHEHTRVPIEIHVHNDLGMAAANSMEGAKAGAEYIDCTLFGIGERSGNCNFYQYIKASEAIFEYAMTKQQINEVEKEVKHLLLH
ncbi:beta/alpha barrel domain-containing protein [Anaeromicropila herbilytica]|uniref:Homocitrate synthase n=1 Tax=Anaeromicropila herbilytica TaxID=2785025 RepID=A0A7R7EPU7_9FIRM|nr:homocitrate synthase [Anaeromicropila herbilytica]BCN32860.1 homocitrate synthase [Anaeromicropila herbilytica]